MCRVPNCDENHNQHHCRLCKGNDVTHFARDCPQGVDLWHGTRITNLSSISLNHGLNPSPTGRLGSGIYFASKEVATAVANHRGDGTGVVVIKARVHLGMMKDCGNAADSSWHGTHDSATSMHGPWVGLPSFKEYVIADKKRHKIKEVSIVGDIVNGELWLPRVDIRVHGNVTFNCKVTAGNIILCGNLTVG